MLKIQSQKFYNKSITNILIKNIILNIKIILNYCIIIKNGKHGYSINLVLRDGEKVILLIQCQ